MANNISEKLAESWKKLPNAINGNGQNFIFLLKTLLGDLKDELDDKFEEISNIANSVTDAPEEMDEQLQNCKIQEVRVGTNISFILTWDHSNVKNYDSAEIYIKETKGNIADHKNWDEVEVSRTIRTTKTDTVTVDGINAGYIYQITFQAKNTFGSVSRKSGCPVLQYEVSSMNNSPDPPLEFNVYFNKDGVLWTWKQPVDLDSSYSELRTNTNVGDKEGLLEVTQDTKSTVLPPAREGTAYLYNKGYGSKYSTPLSKPWSKPIPSAPQSITAISTYQGLQFTYSQIPEDCQGICISINGKKHYTKDDKFNYYCSTGSYTYKACFYDCFGEGIWTPNQTIATLEEIPPDAVHITQETVFDDGVIVGKYIGDHEVVGTKIKDGTITTENLSAGCVTANELASNSVTTDKIEAGAINADKIATGAVTAKSIGAGAITADKLTSGAVTADKLAANTINLAGALKIVGGNVTLDENGLKVAKSDGGSVAFNSNGMTFSDKNKNVFNVTAASIMGACKNGSYIKFTNPWPNIPTVIVTPVNVVLNNPSYSTSVINLHCYADNITTNGFYVRAYSSIANANGQSAPNMTIFNKTYRVNRANDNAGGVYSETQSFTLDVPKNVSEICVNGRFTFYMGYENSAYVTFDQNKLTINSGGSLVRSITLDIPGNTGGRSSKINYYTSSTWYDNFASYKWISVNFSTGYFGVTPGQSCTGTMQVYPHTQHNGDDTDDLNVKVYVDSINFRVNGEQVLDANGTAAFFVVDNINSNYSVQ